LKLFWFHFGCQNGSPKHPKRHKIEKKTAQARKIRLFENEHLAYTKHSFSRVQGAKNTPKVNQSRSEGLSKITSIFTSILGLIFLNFDSILGSQSQPFGTHNHPLGAFWDPQPFPGPSFGTPSLPLDPLASYWGPFDTLPGSGESLPGASWDPLGPFRTTHGIPRLHLGPSGCPSWQPLVFLFGTGAAEAASGSLGFPWRPKALQRAIQKSLKISIDF
jgi:hypothetical protein